MKQPRFNIGDQVFHILPESRPGVVVEIKFVFSTQHLEYMVAFTEDVASLWYMEHELTDTISFNSSAH